MWVLAWEDTIGLGDQDFNDFLAVVRVSKEQKHLDAGASHPRSFFGSEVAQGVVSDHGGGKYPFVAGKDTLVRLHLDTPCPPCSSGSLAGGELRLYERRGRQLLGPSFVTTDIATPAFLGAIKPGGNETVDLRIVGAAITRAEDQNKPGFIRKIEYVAEAEIARKTLGGADSVPAACMRVTLPPLRTTRPWSVLVVPIGKTATEAEDLLKEDLPLSLARIFEIYVAANPFPTPPAGSYEPWVILHPTKVHVPPCFEVFGITTLSCAVGGLSEILEEWNEEGSKDRCPTSDTCKPKVAAIVGLLPDRLWRNDESPGFTLPTNRLVTCPPLSAGEEFEPLISMVVLDTKFDLVGGEPATPYIFTHEIGHVRGLVPHDRGDSGAHTKNSTSGPWGWSSASGTTSVPAGSAMGGSNVGLYDVFFERPDYLCLMDQIDDRPLLPELPQP